MPFRAQRKTGLVFFNPGFTRIHPFSARKFHGDALTVATRQVTENMFAAVLIRASASQMSLQAVGLEDLGGCEKLQVFT